MVTAVLVGCWVVGLGLTGCEGSRQTFVTHPPGTLPVAFEGASASSSCLVACVTMSANYLLGKRQFAEPEVRTTLAQRHLDETSIKDLQTFLSDSGQGLELMVLSGQLDDQPPRGIRFWIERKGYPVIAIINKRGKDPKFAKFNHAVVVTGFSTDTSSSPADIVYYLDPSTSEPMVSVTRTDFEKYWSASDRAMLLVVQPTTSDIQGQ